MDEEVFEFEGGKGEGYGCEEAGERWHGKEDVMEECGATAGDARVEDGAGEAGNGWVGWASD